MLFVLVVILIFIAGIMVMNREEKNRRKMARKAAGTELSDNPSTRMVQMVERMNARLPEPTREPDYYELADEREANRKAAE